MKREHLSRYQAIELKAPADMDGLFLRSTARSESSYVVVTIGDDIFDDSTDESGQQCRNFSAWSV